MDTPSGFKHLFRALGARNYRLFFTGQALSLLGTWVQQVGVGWLAYRLTKSPAWLGLIAFSSQIPTFLAAPFAGVLTDRWNKRTILLVTQILAMAQAALLTLLVLTGTIAPWHLVVLSIWAGTISGFEMTTRHSLLVEMVDDKDHLGNAIALNSALFNSSRLIGPALAGFLIAAVGEGICFLINTISFFAIIIALVRIDNRPKAGRKSGNGVFREMKEGFSYTIRNHTIRSLIILIAVISFAGYPFGAFLPVFAKDIFKGGPETLGLLTSAIGLGALAGALLLAKRKTLKGSGKQIALAAILFGGSLAIVSHAGNLAIALAVLPLAGYGMMTQSALGNTLLQAVVDDDKRGRVLSFYIMAFIGMAPLGSLVQGWIAHARPGNIRPVMMAGGLVCLFAGLLFLFRLPRFRREARALLESKDARIKIEQGIETASQIQDRK